ncbi:MAG: hypothetical protein LBB48_01095 [Treponema sp.]|jgi:hypothetical protein|nr:hypothetical protein [Treponema sp.]
MIKKITLFVLTSLAATYIASCSLFDPDPPDSVLSPNKKIVIDSGVPVSAIDFSDVSSSVSARINNLTNKSVYLVKYAGASAAATQTGYAVSSEYPAQPLAVASGQGAASAVFTAEDGSAGVRYDPLAAQRFNRNPPPPPEGGGASRAPTEKTRIARKVYTENGSAGLFWVEVDSSGNWGLKPATLWAQSEHAAVWVAEDNFTETATSNDNKITQAQAETLASKFDVIYEKETPVFGYEYGGGPGGNGGQDGDLKIQILVYDIDGDYFSGQTGGVFGYFWAKDFYTQQEVDKFGLETNYAEIFYLDAHLAGKFPDGAVSTLAHEFQHMINFNEKSVKSNFTQASETWFDEMLAMLAEDIIDPLAGVAESEYPYNQRMPLFLNVYSDCAPTTWLEGNNVLYSYANSYAFGAYLTRNFGGARLIKEMMTNGKVNGESVAAAVNVVAARGGGWTFARLLYRYGEALVFSGNKKPVGVFSFDNTVTETIDGTDYTCAGFDIWDMDNPRAGQKLSREYSAVYPPKGPLVIDVDYIIGMNKNTFIVQSNKAWQNKTGDLTLTLNKPASSAVSFFIMIK